VNTLKKEAPKARLTYQGREVQEVANEVGPKDKRPNEVGPKDKKNHPMKSCCGGVFCPSLGACVFGASSSPSVLG